MTASSSATGIRPIIWADDHLKLIDQRVLPNEERWVDCRSAAEVADAIHGMAVRGAPAIGIAAAYGLVLDALAGRDYEAADRVLMESRPTAVNLRWALLRMRELKSQGADAKALLAEAIRIHEEDLAQNLAMGEAGAAPRPGRAVCGAR